MNYAIHLLTESQKDVVGVDVGCIVFESSVSCEVGITLFMLRINAFAT